MNLLTRRALPALALLPFAACLAVRAAQRNPQVVAVPSRPAFVRPPGQGEASARIGLTLPPASLLRTQKPGRMQVQLADGRSFRLGGDAVLRLGQNTLELEKGQIIAWVNPGSKGKGTLRIQTRVATASIEGTTVFLEATDEQVKVFSWEGHVRVSTSGGARFDLQSGEEVLYRGGSWLPPRRLSQEEASTRLQRSILLNDFPAPMETLATIRRILEAPVPAAAPSTGTTPSGAR